MFFQMFKHLWQHKLALTIIIVKKTRKAFLNMMLLKEGVRRRLISVSMSILLMRKEVKRKLIMLSMLMN